jgi:hypothetical protein
MARSNFHQLRDAALQEEEEIDKYIRTLEIEHLIPNNIIFCRFAMAKIFSRSQ